jgi:hypothetical protein
MTDGKVRYVPVGTLLRYGTRTRYKSLYHWYNNTYGTAGIENYAYGGQGD